MIEFDLRQELLAAFEGEYREHLGAMRGVLEGGAVSGAALRDVFRRAHSLKGAARAVDLPRIEQIAHDLETLLYASVEAARALPSEHVAEVRRGLDSIEAGMRGDASAAAGTGPGSEVGDGLGVDSRLSADPGGELSAGAGSEVGQGNEPGQAAGGLGRGTGAVASSEAPVVDAGSRVSALEIDRLVENVQAASEAMLGQGQGRQWLSDHVAGLRRLSRLCEAHEQGQEIAGAARVLLRSAAARLREGRYEDWQREQTIAALRAQAERVALVSADSVFGPLAAMARALGRDLQRDLGLEGEQEIAVRLEGMALLADRPVLQALRDPVIQLLRNAIGHGLGSRLREAAVREEPATVGLAVSIQAGRLQVEVSDNGHGPDLATIASRARQQGLLAEGVALPDEAGLLALAFEPGFSTATAVDRLSGRGMGLSIVSEAAARLGGTASMRARRDAQGRVCGTALTVTVPLSARRQALLLVEAGGHVVALPCESVRRLRTVPWTALARTDGRWVARIERDRTLVVRSLAGVLGGVSEGGGERPAELVVLGAREGGGETGLLVDSLREVVTLVVRSPALVGIDRSLVGGVAVTQDHRPVLVLEPGGLLERWDSRSGMELAGGIGAGVGRGASLGSDAATLTVPSRSRRRRPTILVVDDSITTRTLEKTILQAQGYKVLIAVDGLEALDVLRTAEREIDIVVADVEMPRLDGFGLVAAIKADPRLKAMPVVLMTSRNDEADIRRGLDLGASAYLTKQEFEQGALLSVIGQLLP